MSSRGTITWLLEREQPAVRYHTLVDLLDRSVRDPEVRAARAAIPRRGWAADILQAQQPGGYWESHESLYRPKYVATNWRLLVLADLGLTAQDPRVRKPSELFLRQYAKPDGGFGGPKADGSHFCVTGNLARTLVRFGYAQDSRVRSAFDWLVDEQKSDGGWHCFQFNRGTLDCWEALSAFAVLPRAKWTHRIKRAVERGAEFYLEHQLYREGRRRYAPWFRFHYPVHYYYDLLVGLDVLTALGYGDDSRLRYALRVLQEKRRPDGTWVVDAVHPDIARGDPYTLDPPVYPFALEQAGAPSKWITFLALRVLKRVEGTLPKS